MISLDCQTSPLVSEKNYLYFRIIFIKYEISGYVVSHWIWGQNASDSIVTNIKSNKRDLNVFSARMSRNEFVCWGADALVRAGPLVWLCPTEADEGVGRGPGGPPHKATNSLPAFRGSSVRPLASPHPDSTRPCEDRAAQRSNLPWPLMPIRDPDWTLASGGGQKRNCGTRTLPCAKKSMKHRCSRKSLELATVDDRTSD